MDIVYPDDIPQARELFSQVMENPGKTFKGDIRLRHKNGGKIVANYRVTNLLDDPKVKSIIINYRDVTEHRAIEERYKTLVEQGNDGILIVQDNLLKYANQILYKTLGYTSEEVIDAPFIQYIAPEYQKIVAERYNRRIQGLKTPHIYEIALVAKDGRHIPVEINTSLIDYEGKPAVMAMVRDIIKRKQAEERQRERRKMAFNN